MNVGAEVMAGLKRPADGPWAGAGRGKNKKRKTGGGTPLPKNALMQLNEIKPGLIYNVVEQGGECIDKLLNFEQKYTVMYFLLPA